MVNFLTLILVQFCPSRVLAGVLCCAWGTLTKYGIPATAAGLELTYQAAVAAGIVGGAAVGGLFACCFGATASTGAMMVCLPCFVMPCYYADNAALIDGVDDVTSWSVDCFSFSLFSMCCLAWLVTSTKRSEMR